MVFLYILSAVAVILLAAYICFRMAFFADRKATNDEEFPLPEGEIYKPFREQMIQWIKEVRSLPREEVSITSFDGLTLRGNYYECIPGAGHGLSYLVDPQHYLRSLKEFWAQ